MNKNKSFLIFGVGFFIYLILFALQGLDVTDEGYILSNFSLVFQGAEYVTPQFYYTNLIGGLIYEASPANWGVYPYKLAFVLSQIFIFWVVYRVLLRFFSEQKLVLLSVILASFLIVRFQNVYLNYNTLTSLLLVLGVACLSLGLLEKKWHWLTLAGYFFGSNIFVRLPNGLLVFVVLVIFYQDGVRTKQAWRALGFYILGLGVAGLQLLVLAKLLGHWPYFAQTFSGLWQELQEPVGSSTHSLQKLLWLFVKDQGYALVCSGLAFVIGFLGIRITKNFRKKTVLVVTVVVLLVIALVFWFSPSWFTYRTLKSIDSWILNGVIYLVAGLMFFANLNKELKSFLLLSLLVCILTPLGSNNSMRNAMYGMAFVLPLCFLFLLDAGKMFSQKWQIDCKQLKPFQTILVVSLLFYGFAYRFVFVYRDNPNRLAMLTRVEHPRLHGIYTTQKRAKVVGDMIGVLQKHVQAGDQLLVYGQIPILHFVLQTKPYLDVVWPEVNPPKRVQMLLKRAQEKTFPLPVVVRSRFSTETVVWPQQKKQLNNSTKIENIRLFDEFVKQNGYVLTWSNEMFEILLPK